MQTEGYEKVTPEMERDNYLHALRRIQEALPFDTNEDPAHYREALAMIHRDPETPLKIALLAEIALGR